MAPLIATLAFTLALSAVAYGGDDILPVPFKELSSIQFYTPEEQLLELSAALKEQFGRHCFIKVHNQKTQPMLVPFVQQFYTPPKNLTWYKERALAKAGACPAAEIDDVVRRNSRGATVIKQRKEGAGICKTSGWTDLIGKE